MKKPSFFAGYVDLKGNKYTFYINHSQNELVLIPTDINDWKKSSGINAFIEKISRTSINYHKWIEPILIKGITKEKSNIMISINGAYSNDNGILICKINWLYLFDEDKIDGIRIKGVDINRYYPPYVASTTEYEFEDNHSIKQISITAKKAEVLSAGKYSIQRGISATIELQAYATSSPDSYNPICNTSEMVLSFSKSINISKLVDVYITLKHFFKYITYRQNIEIDDLQVFKINNNGLRENIGVFIWYGQKPDKETNKNSESQLISFDVLGKKTAKLFTLIKNDTFAYAQIPNSLEDRRHYTTDRNILLLTAFEREYRAIYGENYKRSESFITTKTEIEKLITEYANNKTGKDKKAAKEIKRFVSKIDSNYGQKLKIAFEDCEEILKPFVRKEYGNIGFSYNEKTDEISERMNEFRNYLAHSKLDFEIKAIHLCDLKMVEELTYAIRLKKLGLSAMKCQKAINELFHENFAL